MSVIVIIIGCHRYGDIVNSILEGTRDFVVAVQQLRTVQRFGLLATEYSHPVLTPSEVGTSKLEVEQKHERATSRRSPRPNAHGGTRENV